MSEKTKNKRREMRKRKRYKKEDEGQHQRFMPLNSSPDSERDSRTDEPSAPVGKAHSSCLRLTMPVSLVSRSLSLSEIEDAPDGHLSPLGNQRAR